MPISLLFAIVSLLGAGLLADQIPSISSCGNGRRLVALTFDDGPDALYDDRIMEELDQLGVKATFFLAPYARGYNEEIICQKTRQLHQRGHDIQIHSMRHPSFPGLGWPAVAKELKESFDWLKQCGAAWPNMFRPPFGELLPSQARQIYDHFGTIIAMWNVESGDHNALNQNQIFYNIARRFEQNVGVGNSAVILMHNFYIGQHPGLITRIVNYFRERGYTTVSMNECYQACGERVCKGNGGPSPFRNVFIP